MRSLINVTKAYSYTRMSTAEQLKGDSLRRQVDKAAGYAASRGWTLVDRYDDIGVSAYHGKNAEFGELQAFIAAVDSGVVEPGSALLVESIDRLSRQKINKALSLLLSLIGKGIIVVTLSPEQVYSAETTEESMQLIGALFVMARAHEESSIKAMRLREVWKSKRSSARKEGVVSTRRIPSWLFVEDGVIRINEYRASVVREIFEMTRDGYGAYSLSRLLNARDEAPWGSRANAVWRDSFIKKMIRSRAVLGEYQPHVMVGENGKDARKPEGEPIRDYYPQVVDVALFRSANEAMDARKLTGRGRKGVQHKNVFSGLLRCQCGAGYRWVSKGPKPKGGDYLQCSVSLSGGKCKMPLIKYHLMEEVVLGALETLDARKIIEGGVLESKTRELRTRHAELSDRMDVSKVRCTRFAKAIGDGLDSETLRANLREEESAVRQIGDELKEVRVELEKLAQSNPDERRAALAQLIVAMSGKGDEDAVKARRTLASELRMMIDKIKVYTNAHVAEELVEGGPGVPLEDVDNGQDEVGPSVQIDWKTRYRVKSIHGLRKLLRDRCFEVEIFYRTGASERIDSLEGAVYKAKAQLKMKQFRLVNR